MQDYITDGYSFIEGGTITPDSITVTSAEWVGEPLTLNTSPKWYTTGGTLTLSPKEPKLKKHRIGVKV